MNHRKPQTLDPLRSPLKRFGLARVLSKLGVCSRSRATELIVGGQVKLNGTVVRNAEHPVVWPRDRIDVADCPVGEAPKVYLALNKPRGLVTSRSDEQGRETVYACLKEAGLPFLGPVGRLDKASEGLLLLTNDTEWAAGITDPRSRVEKEYHVQVNALPDAAMAERIQRGVEVEGEHLGATRVEVLRSGTRNGWFRIVLQEGRNRHIRRLLAAHGLDVLRLVRVRIGPVSLGELAKGGYRPLSADEIAVLRGSGHLRSRSWHNPGLRPLNVGKDAACVQHGHPGKQHPGEGRGG